MTSAFDTEMGITLYDINVAIDTFSMREVPVETLDHYIWLHTEGSRPGEQYDWSDQVIAAAARLVRSIRRACPATAASRTDNAVKPRYTGALHAPVYG